MEVLNKNQRRSSLWRLVLLNLFLFALVAVGLFAMHNAYAGQGSEEIKKLEKELEEKGEQCQVEIKDLQNDLRRKSNDYKNCMESQKNNQEVFQLEQKIEQLNKDLNDVTEDRNDYRTRFRNCRDNQ